MFPMFLKHKKRELTGLYHFVRGKLTGNHEERLRGINEALNALEDEKEIYLSEKRDAVKNVDPEYGGYQKNEYVPQDKVIRESNNRDISGY